MISEFKQPGVSSTTRGAGGEGMLGDPQKSPGAKRRTKKTKKLETLG